MNIRKQIQDLHFKENLDISEIIGMLHEDPKFVIQVINEYDGEDD